MKFCLCVHYKAVYVCIMKLGVRVHYETSSDTVKVNQNIEIHEAACVGRIL